LRTYPELRQFIILLILSTLLFGGCRKEDKVVETHDYLLKCGTMIISIDDFSEELEMKRVAYPYSIQKNINEYNQLVMRLAAQLAEELVLKRVAAEKGIAVTEQQAIEAETRFRADYPGSTFETMLLENAVTYPWWKKKFKTRLLIDRLIEEEINKKLEITAGEITQYYERYKKARDIDSTDTEAAISESDLVKRLRMKKTEENYSQWIEALKNEYPVEINKLKLKSLLEH